MKLKRIVLVLLVVCLAVCIMTIHASAAVANKLDTPVVTASNSPASGKISLSWNAVNGASSYKIYRATSKSGPFTRVRTTSNTTYTNTSVIAGSAYYYYVVAVGSNGATSKSSDVVKRTCDLPRPSITLSNVESSGKIKITWDAVSDAISYKLYSSTDGKNWSLLKNTTGTKLTHTSAVAGKMYYYKLKAISNISAANSAYSKTKSRTCDLPRPTISSIGNSAYSGKITLTWKAVSGAETYKVYRSTSEKGTYSVVGTTNKTSFTNTSTVAGKTYYYKVKAIAANTNANSALSKLAYRTCDLPRPTITLTNVASTGKIRITWDAISNAVSYMLYSSVDNQNWKLLITTSKTSILHTSGIAGTTYYYKVKAIAEKTAANSAYSNVKYRTCDLPRPVVSLTNTASTGRVQLSWSPINGAIKYKIYRSKTKSGTYSYLISTEDTTIVDKTGAAGVTYYYKVLAAASNSSANSAHSVAKAGTFEYLDGLYVQTGLNSDGKPRLTWNEVNGAADYAVYRATSKSGKYNLIYTTTGTTTTNNSAAWGVTYYYKVIARNTSGNKIYESDRVSVTLALPGGEVLKKRYVSDVSISVYIYPDSTSEATTITYMEAVSLGMKVSESDSGSWYRLFYGGKLYYIWMPPNNNKLTSKLSNFTYEGNTPLQQEVIDLALEINRWDTFYTNDESTGIPNADGSFGFDCSGLVSYIMNTVMQKYVPTYHLGKNTTILLTTESIYNAGLPGEFIAYDVDLEDMQPGDVIFFSQSTPFNHCGIYLGNNEFIHCSSLWDAVRIMPISGMYLEDFACVRRHLPEKVESADTTMYVNYSTAYLYADHNDESEKIQTLRKGDAVTVLYSNNGNWVYVRIADGTEGYMLIKRLDTENST